MEQANQFWSPDQLAITIGAVVMLVFVVFILLANRKRQSRAIDARVADDLARGDYRAAAERELAAGHLRTAYDLFLRARQPLLAAPIAVRQGRLRDAAELFEKAGVRDRAVELYRQLGMAAKADALLAENGKGARGRVEPAASPAPRMDGEAEAATDQPLLDQPVAKPAPAARVLAAATKAGATPAPVKVTAMPSSKPEAAARGSRALDLDLPPLPGQAQGKPPALAPPEVVHTPAIGPAIAPSVEAPHPVAPLPPSSPAGALDFGEAKPVLQEPAFGEAKPRAASRPPAKPLAVSYQEVKSPAVPFSLDEVESGPVRSPIVEGLPEAIAPEANLTPPAPTPVASSSVGAYRMVRPSQPDVFTPPPATRGTPGPMRTPSGEHPAERAPKSPTPRPTLRVGTKSGSGERRTGGTPAPATLRLSGPCVPGSRTPAPAAGTGQDDPSRGRDPDGSGK